MLDKNDLWKFVQSQLPGAPRASLRRIYRDMLKKYKKLK